MADFRNLSEAQAKMTFAEGAARLNGVVQTVKARQAGECLGTHCVTEYSISNFSPDEVWAKNFATYGIGPQIDARLPGLPAQPFAEVKPVAKPAAREPMQMVAHAPAAEPRERRSVFRAILFGHRG